jgi:hypothetical protein
MWGYGIIASVPSKALLVLEKVSMKILVIGATGRTRREIIIHPNTEKYFPNKQYGD